MSVQIITDPTTVKRQPHAGDTLITLDPTTDRPIVVSIEARGLNSRTGSPVARFWHRWDRHSVEIATLAPVAKLPGRRIVWATSTVEANYSIEVNGPTHADITTTPIPVESESDPCPCSTLGASALFDLADTLACDHSDTDDDSDDDNPRPCSPDAAACYGADAERRAELVSAAATVQPSWVDGGDSIRHATAVADSARDAINDGRYATDETVKALWALEDALERATTDDDESDDENTDTDDDENTDTNRVVYRVWGESGDLISDGDVDLGTAENVLADVIKSHVIREACTGCGVLTRPGHHGFSVQAVRGEDDVTSDPTIPTPDVAENVAIVADTTTHACGEQVERDMERGDLSDASALAVAGWWQSPGRVGKWLAMLASVGHAPSLELFDDISRTQRDAARTGAYGADDKRALDLLAGWVFDRCGIAY